MVKRLRTSAGGQGGGGTTIVYIEVPVGDSGVVNDERLTYDLPEVYPDFVEDASFVNSVEEELLAPVETGILGVLLLAEELEPVATEDVTGTEAQVQVDGSGPTPLSDISLDSFVEDNLPSPEDIVEGAFLINEASLAPQEDLSDSEVIIVLDALLTPPEDETSVVASVAETRSVEEDLANISINWLNGPNANINDGWVSPNNIHGNNFASAALSIASTGSLGTGTTAQNKSGTLTGTYFDPQITDLTIDQVLIDFFCEGDETGTKLSDGEIFGTIRVSFNNGSAWTNIHTISANPADDLFISGGRTPMFFC